jgi:hypothetical protein
VVRGGSKGLDALKKVHDEDPATYARVVASLQRKEVEVYRTPEERLEDDEVEMLYQAQLAKLREVAGAAAPIPAPGSQRGASAADRDELHGK